MSRELIICPNLELGVQVGKDSWITITPSKKPPSEPGRVRMQYSILRPDLPDYVNDDLQSGRIGTTTYKEMMCALLSFALHDAEWYRSRLMKNKLDDLDDPNDDGPCFTRELAEWFYQNDDELQICQMELEDDTGDEQV